MHQIELAAASISREINRRGYDALTVLSTVSPRTKRTAILSVLLEKSTSSQAALNLIAMKTA